MTSDTLLLYGVVLIFVALVAGGVLLLALPRIFKISVPVSKLPYKRKNLLSEGEYKFFLVLQEAVYGKYYVAPKPRLADIIEIRGAFLWKLFSPISQKHVDFVLCDHLMKTVLVVEHDDKTHTHHFSFVSR